MTRCCANECASSLRRPLIRMLLDHSWDNRNSLVLPTTVGKHHRGLFQKINCLPWHSMLAASAASLTLFLSSCAAGSVAPHPLSPCFLEAPRLLRAAFALEGFTVYAPEPGNMLMVTIRSNHDRAIVARLARREQSGRIYLLGSECHASAHLHRGRGRI